MKKRILAIVLMVALVLGATNVAFASQRSYSISNLTAGAPLWSGGTVLKGTAENNGFVQASTFTAGSTFDCRLYLSDKSTRAMSNYLTVNYNQIGYRFSSGMSYSGSYNVYMKFSLGSGSAPVATTGIWGTQT